MQYWMIQGIGLDVCNVESYFNSKKAARCFYENGHEFEMYAYAASDDAAMYDIDEFCTLCGFDGMADVLCFADKTNTLTYGTDCAGYTYVYYPPSMPWERIDTEPTSLEQAIQNIINAVRAVTDMPAYLIREAINVELCELCIG